MVRSNLLTNQRQLFQLMQGNQFFQKCLGSNRFTLLLTIKETYVMSDSTWWPISSTYTQASIDAQKFIIEDAMNSRFMFTSLQNFLQYFGHANISK